MFARNSGSQDQRSTTGELRGKPLDASSCPTAAIDRRRVANPSQAQALLASVANNDPALEAFFATIYYAGARPGEVMNLRLTDCKLPTNGWGQLLLNSSYRRPGTTWTGTTDPSEERQLKHRAIEDTRPVPAHPLLVEALRRHLRTFENGVDGRLFVSRIGRGEAAKPQRFTRSGLDGHPP